MHRDENNVQIVHLGSESDPSNGTRFEIQITSGYWTVLRLRGRGSLESVLDEAVDHMAEDAPGLVTDLTEELETARLENPDATQDQLWEIAQQDMSPIGDMWIPSETLHYSEL